MAFAHATRDPSRWKTSRSEGERNPHIELPDCAHSLPPAADVMSTTVHIVDVSKGHVGPTSPTVQRGNAKMYRRSGLVISREQGLRYDAGFAVPVLMS